MSKSAKRVAYRYLMARAPIPMEMITDPRVRYGREEMKILQSYLDQINSGQTKSWLSDSVRDWKAFATGNRNYWEGTDLESYYEGYKKRRVNFKAVYAALKELLELL